MEREQLIKQTTRSISLLPDNKLRELADYVEFLLQKKTEKELAKDITALSASSNSLNFLEEEEELYADSDLTEKFY